MILSESQKIIVLSTYCFMFKKSNKSYERQSPVAVFKFLVKKFCNNYYNKNNLQ